MAFLAALLTIVGSALLSAASVSHDDLPEQKPTGIIVLGGKLSLFIQYPKLKPSDIPDTRMAEAIRLAKAYPQAVILYSGREAAPGPMPTFLRAGIARERVVWEDSSESTAENATFGAGLMRPRPSDHWLLVTDDWHMARAQRCFERAGFAVMPKPVHDPSHGLRSIERSLHEAAGRFAYAALDLCDPGRVLLR